MTISTTQAPEYQLAGGRFGLIFSATVGNFVRAVVTVAPPSSGYAAQLEEQQSTEIDLGGAATGQLWLGFEPDAPGAYTLKLYEITVGASDYGGQFASDYDAYGTETIEGTTTLTVYVGQRLESPIGAGADTATLVLHVWDDTVRATTLEQHDVDSPALIDPASAKAETFVADSAVATALDNMRDAAATDVAASPTTVLNNIVDEFADHLTQGSVHSSNDTDNTPSDALRGATTPEALAVSVSELQRLMKQHFANDAGDGNGPGGASYHSTADRLNTPIAPAPTDYAASIFALADMWRAYEAHRVSTSFHSTSDTTNSLAALTTGSILALCKAVSDVLSAPAPTPPSTDNEGATTLVHGAGMERV